MPSKEVNTKINYFVFYLWCSLILKKTLKSFDKVAKYYIIIICVYCVYVFRGTYSKTLSDTNIHTIHFHFKCYFLFATFFFFILSSKVYQHLKCNHRIPILFFRFFLIKEIHKERNAT